MTQTAVQESSTKQKSQVVEPVQFSWCDFRKALIAFGILNDVVDVVDPNDITGIQFTIGEYGKGRNREVCPFIDIAFGESGKLHLLRFRGKFVEDNEPPVWEMFE